MIKRYWWSFAVTALVLAGVGSFYIQAAAESRPQLKLEQVSGNPQEAEGLEVYGRYSKAGFDSTVMVGTSGTRFASDDSVLSQISRSSRSHILKGLTDRYPSFMRGKPEEQGFYEDEQFLAYGAIAANSDYTDFKVARLDKKTKKTVSHRIPVPNARQFRTIFAMDTQLINGGMKIVTSNYGLAQTVEYHLYTIDIEKGSVVSDQLLTSRSNDNPDSKTTVNTSVFPATGTGAGPYTIIETIHKQKVETAGRTTYVPTQPAQLSVYDLRSGQLDAALGEALTKLVHEGEQLQAFEPDKDRITLLLRDTDDAAVRLVHYDLAGKQIQEQIISFANKDLVTSNLQEGRLYVMTTPLQKEEETLNRSPVGILIYDSATGSPIYEGKIEWSSETENGTASRLSDSWDFYYLTRE